MTDLNTLISRWNSDEGKPYKGKLIDMEAYRADEPDKLGCMCAQGQVLYSMGGWTVDRLQDTSQSIADRDTAQLLNISTAHAILLRNINDGADGAPAIVLTHPERVLGDQAQTVLAFWRHLDAMDAAAGDAAGDAARDAARVAAGDAARVAAGDAARVAARVAAWDAARDAAWDAARDAAGVAAGDAAWDAARDAARDAAGASNEIQGAAIMRERGQPFYFLPLFGFATPEDIPPLPADYGAPIPKP